MRQPRLPIPRTARLIVALAIAATALLSLAHADPARQACHAVSARTCEIAHDLGRGVNLGNVLDAPQEGDWGLRLEPALLAVPAGHFRTVRLPVRWSNHAAPGAEATLQEPFARRVDQAVDQLLAQGHYVILNVHHYTQLTGGKLHPREFAVDPAVVETRLVSLWRQIALRYRDRSDRLLFELLNEPHDALSGERWNRLAARALAAVRAVDAQRIVMIGPDEWNHPRGLHRLRLPRDPHLIAAIHSYDPFDFTHQAVPWRTPVLAGGRSCCDPGQRAQVAQALDQAMAWNRRSGVPMHLGEFGAYRAGDLVSRAAYARLVRDEAERRGLGWAWWELASDFSGVWEPQEGRWVEPLRRALLEPAANPVLPTQALREPARPRGQPAP
jgi:endoglucanase